MIFLAEGQLLRLCQIVGNIYNIFCLKKYHINFILYLCVENLMCLYTLYNARGFYFQSNQ